MTEIQNICTLNATTTFKISQKFMMSHKFQNIQLHLY
jgi:hypothetical protein